MIKTIHLHVKKTFAALALLSLELLIVLVLFFISLAAFLFIANEIFLQNKTEFDTRVFDSLRPYVSDFTTSVMLSVTFLGTGEFMVPANLVLLIYFLFIEKHRWYSIKIPVISLTSLGIMMGLKQLFNRARPDIPLLDVAHGLSFPSGHAFTSVTFYGLLAYIVWERVKSPALKWIVIGALLVLIHLIGFSRIYLRVHYASDVIAGFCVGWIWLVISLLVLRRLERFSHKKVDPVVKEEKPLEVVIQKDA
jgi:membrane-associated phospholipid phosphatase